MDIQKFISALVGTAGLDLDKFLAGLGIDEKIEYRKIQTAVEYFKELYIEETWWESELWWYSQILERKSSFWRTCEDSLFIE